jgi:hypothetical protein
MANQASGYSVSLDRSSQVVCLHRRLIDDVLTKDGERTGKVRCIECGTVFDYPYHEPR